MPRYIIEVIERYRLSYEVDAESEEEACASIERGDEEPLCTESIQFDYESIEEEAE